jgi:hypothetical protein
MSFSLITALPVSQVRHATNAACRGSNGFAGSSAVRVRTPCGLIDEVCCRRQPLFPGRTATRRVARPRKNSGKRLAPRFFNRICKDYRASGDRWGCRRGGSAGERVPYDQWQPRVTPMQLIVVSRPGVLEHPRSALSPHEAMVVCEACTASAQTTKRTVSNQPWVVCSDCPFVSKACPYCRSSINK